MSEMSEIQYLRRPTKVTREAANEILDAWRSGAKWYPKDVINMALMATGDIRPCLAVRGSFR